MPIYSDAVQAISIANDGNNDGISIQIRGLGKSHWCRKYTFGAWLASTCAADFKVKVHYWVREDTAPYAYLFHFTSGDTTIPNTGVKTFVTFEDYILSPYDYAFVTLEISDWNGNNPVTFDLSNCSFTTVNDSLFMEPDGILLDSASMLNVGYIERVFQEAEHKKVVRMESLTTYVSGAKHLADLSYTSDQVVANTTVYKSKFGAMVTMPTTDWTFHTGDIIEIIAYNPNESYFIDYTSVSFGIRFSDDKLNGATDNVNLHSPLQVDKGYYCNNIIFGINRYYDEFGNSLEIVDVDAWGIGTEDVDSVTVETDVATNSITCTMGSFVLPITHAYSYGNIVDFDFGDENFGAQVRVFCGAPLTHTKILGAGDGTAGAYTFSIDNTSLGVLEIEGGTVTITATKAALPLMVATDVPGAFPAGTWGGDGAGTIDYSTGDITITFSNAVLIDTNIICEYSYNITLEAFYSRKYYEGTLINKVNLDYQERVNYPFLKPPTSSLVTVTPSFTAWGADWRAVLNLDSDLVTDDCLLTMDGEPIPRLDETGAVLWYFDTEKSIVLVNAEYDSTASFSFTYSVLMQAEFEIDISSLNIHKYDHLCFLPYVDIFTAGNVEETEIDRTELVRFDSSGNGTLHYISNGDIGDVNIIQTSPNGDLTLPNSAIRSLRDDQITIDNIYYRNDAYYSVTYKTLISRVIKYDDWTIEWSYYDTTAAAWSTYTTWVNDEYVPQYHWNGATHEVINTYRLKITFNVVTDSTKVYFRNLGLYIINSRSWDIL